MNMQCMLQISPTTLLLGGHQNIIVEFDVESRKEIRQVSFLIGLSLPLLLTTLNVLS